MSTVCTIQADSYIEGNFGYDLFNSDTFDTWFEKGIFLINKTLDKKIPCRFHQFSSIAAFPSWSFQSLSAALKNCFSQEECICGKSLHKKS